MKILILLLLISCSHRIVVKTPASKFLSAESQGKTLKGNFKLFYGFGREAQLDLRNGQRDNELKLNNDEIRMFDLLVNGEIGIYGPIDLIHISGGRLASDMTGFKWQLYGDTRQTAGKNNTSFSIFTGYGRVVNNVQEGEDFELTPQDDDTTSELNLSNRTVGFLLGHRVEENVLVNFGYHQIRHNFFGELESQNTDLNGKSINYLGLAHIYTLGVFSYKNSTILGFELSSETIKWDHTQESTVAYGNISFGYQW